MNPIDKIVTLFNIDMFSLVMNILEATIIFTCFYIFAVICKKITIRFFLDKVKNNSIIKLISNSMKNFIVLSGLITSISNLGIDISALVAGLGLTGFAVGFAFKDSLSNIISGVLILLYQPFKVNNYISVAGIEGEVTSIDLRYTTLKDENKTHLIPNSTLFNKSITIIKNTKTDT